MTPRTPCSNWLPIEPMRRVIQRDAQRLWDAADVEYAKPCKYPGLTLLAHQTGIGERQLRRWLEENAYAEEGAVDRYCCATGRHLFDLYPELDDRPDEADGFSAPCQSCGSASMTIVSERHTRLWLRCIDCGVGQYVDHPRAGPAGRPQRFTDDEARQMRILYEAGWTTERIATRYGSWHSTVATTLRRAGTQMRPRTPPPPNPEPFQSPAFRAYTEARVKRGEKLAWDSARLRLEGHTYREIGRRLGVHHAAVQQAIRRLDKRVPDWREAIEARETETAAA